MTKKKFLAILLIMAALFCSCGQQTSASEETNKSLPRGVSYEDEGTTAGTPVFHLSLDDFIDAFEDITSHENDYESIFENAAFAWMRELHDDYGVVFSCYVYYEKPNFNLSMCTRKYREEFEDNSDWLRFGFHTWDGNTVYSETDRNIAEDYDKTISNLTEIVSEAAIDHIVRIHCYQGSKTQLLALKNNVAQEPVIGYLTADDGRQSYYLNKKENEYIYSHDHYLDDTAGISFISTDIRAEKVTDIDAKIRELSGPAWNNQLKYLVVFTHEWAADDLVKKNIRELCRYATSMKYECSFLEDALIQ